jgi:hypothetical protein
MLGETKFEDLKTSPDSPWFPLGYDLYSFTDGDSYRKLKAIRLNEIEVLAFIGTWCGDTQDHLPGMIRILDTLKLPRDRLKIYALDRAKTFPGGAQLIQSNRISKLPTFIFLRNGLEIGRITETPEVSLIADLARILG